MTLNEVVPWGRTGTEYERMFALTPADLAKRILGCGDGPASFNAEMHRRGGRVVSVDPTYRFSAAQINARIEQTATIILGQVEICRDDYLWDDIPSPQALAELRLGAMETFLEDFPGGGQSGRYLAGELPALPFNNRQFDLALCSHLLFLYSEQLSLMFHLAAVSELCRVAEEVRIFPLLSLAGERSPHLEPVIARIEAAGGVAEVRRVPYEFQRGANEMLVLRPR